MGNNAAFTAFEATVIAVYNRGLLDQELLTELMKPYEGSDIDTGGEMGTLANDGLDIEEIVIKTFGVIVPSRPDLPADHKTWTGEQYAINDAYQEAKAEAFHKINDQLGWG